MADHEEAEVAVTETRFEDDGTTRSEVRWTRTPELTYVLTLSPDARLTGFSAEAGEGHAVSTTRLRLAPIGTMYAEARARALETAQGFASMPSNTFGARDYFKNVVAQFDSGDVDTALAAIAARYADLFKQGIRNPYQRLADEFGINKKAAQNRIYQAREKGLLTSEGRGKAGGVLTDLAREILRSAEED